MAHAHQNYYALQNAPPSSLQGRTSSTRNVTAGFTSARSPTQTSEDPIESMSQSVSSIASRNTDQSTNQWGTESDVSRSRSLISYDKSARSKRNVSILFMGDTGAGKSSFISELTGSAIKVGHSLMPNTTESQVWEYEHGELTISLIDTPGFNDTTRSEMEILNSMATFIMNEDLPPIIGVVYMHRITERRVTGSSRLNLDILRAMCGPEYATSLVLITTMWDTIPEADLAGVKTREKQLNNSSVFWGDLITDGATYAEYAGTLESAQEIIDAVVSNDTTCPTLRIMLEMQNGMAVEDTAAGQVVMAEMRRRGEQLLQGQLENDEVEERRLRNRMAELEEETRLLRERQAWEREQQRLRRRRSGRRSRTVDERPQGREQPGVGFRLSFTGFLSRP